MFNECLKIRWSTAHFVSCILNFSIKSHFVSEVIWSIRHCFHHWMKYLEVRQKYSAARRIFNSLLSVSSLVKHCISCLLYTWHTIGFYRSFTFKITECCLLLFPQGKFDLTGSEEVLLYSGYHQHAPSKGFFFGSNLQFGGRQSTVTMVFTRWQREYSFPISRALGGKLMLAFKLFLQYFATGSDTPLCQDYEEYEFVECLLQETQIIDLYLHTVNCNYISGLSQYTLATRLSSC